MTIIGIDPARMISISSDQCYKRWFYLYQFEVFAVMMYAAAGSGLQRYPASLAQRLPFSLHKSIHCSL